MGLNRPFGGMMCNIDLIGTHISIIKKSTEVLEDLYNESVQGQSLLDKLLLDLEHEIEFNKYDAIHMMKKYKELRDFLNLRRYYKDCQEVLTETRKFMILPRAMQIEGSYNSVKLRQDKRKYTNRVSQSERALLTSVIDDDI
jgi:hypothetical protein